MKERSLFERIIAILGVIIGSIAWIIRYIFSAVRGKTASDQEPTTSKPSQIDSLKATTAATVEDLKHTAQDKIDSMRSHDGDSSSTVESIRHGAEDLAKSVKDAGTSLIDNAKDAADRVRGTDDAKETEAQTTQTEPYEFGFENTEAMRAEVSSELQGKTRFGDEDPDLATLQHAEIGGVDEFARPATTGGLVESDQGAADAIADREAQSGEIPNLPEPGAAGALVDAPAAGEPEEDTKRAVAADAPAETSSEPSYDAAAMASAWSTGAGDEFGKPEPGSTGITSGETGIDALPSSEEGVDVSTTGTGTEAEIADHMPQFVNEDVATDAKRDMPDAASMGMGATRPPLTDTGEGLTYSSFDPVGDVASDAHDSDHRENASGLPLGHSAERDSAKSVDGEHLQYSSFDPVGDVASDAHDSDHRENASGLPLGHSAERESGQSEDGEQLKYSSFDPVGDVASDAHDSDHRENASGLPLGETAERDDSSTMTFISDQSDDDDRHGHGRRSKRHHKDESSQGAEPASGQTGYSEKTAKHKDEPVPAAFGNAVRGDGTTGVPDGYPIKGNAGSRIYHRPEDSSYENTIAEYCFANEEDAKAAGFRPRKH